MDAYDEKFIFKEFESIKILDRYGFSHGWVDSGEKKLLNYYECCGVLILFGIEPPEYSELCKILKIE